MRQLYTERNLLRPCVERAWNVSLPVYELLLDICRKYLVCLAEKFPECCPDGDDVCDVNKRELFHLLKLRIPDLPFDECSNFYEPIVPQSTEFDQFALFDYIEFISQNMVTVVKGDRHSYFNHHHLLFYHDGRDFKRFAEDINDVFKMSGLQYVLTEGRQIERITDADGFVQQAVDDVKLVAEKGLNALITEAVALYHNARPEMHHLATEKIWDAFERTKTTYTNLNKKQSVEKLIKEMANGNAEFVSLFDDEFEALTDIGNKYRIRHHETNKIDIDDDCYCDYLFVRCMSLIDLAIKKVTSH